MFKSKIGTSVQPTVSPDLKGKRINTTGKQLQTSTKPAPRKSMDVLNDPIYRLYVNMMAEFGLLDPYLSYEEVEYKVDTLSRVIREHNLVRERFGPPPVDKGVAAMTEYMNHFSKSLTAPAGAEVKSSVWSNGDWFSNGDWLKTPSAEPPSPSTTSSSSSSAHSFGSTTASSIASTMQYKDDGTPIASLLDENDHPHEQNTSAGSLGETQFSAFVKTIRCVSSASPSNGHAASNKAVEHRSSIDPGHSQVQKGEHKSCPPSHQDTPPVVSAHEMKQFEDKVRRRLLSRLMEEGGVHMEFDESRPWEREMTRLDWVDGKWVPLRTEPAWSTTARAALDMLGAYPFQLPHPEIYNRRHSTSQKKGKSKTTKGSEPIRAKVPAGSGTPASLTLNRVNSDLDGQPYQSCSSSSSIPVSVAPPQPNPLDVSLENQFYARLIANIKEEARRDVGRIDEQIRATLMCLFIFVFNRGPCPSPISGICGSPVCCNASSLELMKAANDFVDFVISLSDPSMVRPGLWGLKPDEVHAIRGIVFLRHVTGWFQEDVENGVVIPVEKDYPKGKGRAITI